MSVTEPPQKTDPYRCCTLSIEGPNATELCDEAIRQAAVFLREEPANLYAAEVGDATVSKRSRFRRHLGEQGRPVRWRAVIKVRLRPEIVRARRGGNDDPPPSGRHLHPVS